ncbi:hypothetical protein PFICI_05601 [Pestalotiopsis fici W106-1]|uniref:Nephrocystin 3-like N-terminal domain-containing protein n=1 Tax=Pestalotiopsis fici (strain W106-1 / CGMCC3.15140) TaxID=1229662 RepID=W3XCG1_PESFW|nr:uncharacterized protein PFICI_05601 [Pestalotiopsis fici W106-1]ETS83725.1 hypothetical protein PFICI_05601 [Pestalotiopsis fici W106-1]
MAEVITLVGQISSLVSLSHDLVGLCCEFFSTVKNAPKELEDVRRELTAFEQSIIGLKGFINAHPEEITNLRQLSLPNGTLDSATEVIKELMDLLEAGKFTPSTGPKRAKLMHTTLERIQQGLRRTNIKEPLEKLRRFRESIQFTLNAALARPILETRQDVVVIKESVQTLKDDQTQFQDDARKLKVLKWFNVDMSGNRSIHKDRLSQQQQSTCQWFTRNPAWNKWLQEREFIWVTGLPGTGKTVLASYLIERASHEFNSKGIAYYYCHHSRNRDESLTLLQHIVKQLISQIDYVPSRIYDNHKRADKLDTDDLLLCLEELSSKFKSGVRVIVDAVDESKPRDKLMSILFTIGTDLRFRRVSLLVTSRPEPDILEGMSPHLSSLVEISMSDPGVTADIRSLVQSELAKLPWEEYFKREIEQCLVGGAKGMFRWVACQIDHIKRLSCKGMNGEQAIRRALNNLPEDVFATYERILLEIPNEDSEFARTALALMCSQHGEMPTAEVLVEACLYRVMGEDINKYDVRLLVDICGCLLRISRFNRPPLAVFKDATIGPFHKVSLAHYTVKEYLVHPDTATRPAKFFALTPQVLETIDIVVAFKGLQRFGTRHCVTNGGKTRVTRYEEDCLKKTEDALNHRRPDFDKNDELYQALIQSLKYSSSHAKHLRLQRGIATDMSTRFSTWDKLINQLETPPKGDQAEQVTLLLSLITLRWYNMAVKYLKSHPDFIKLHPNVRAKIWSTKFKLRATRSGPSQPESLLLLCVRQRRLNFLSLFIQHDASFEKESEVLYAAMYSPDDEDNDSDTTLAFLRTMTDLGRGAKADPVPFRQANDHRGSNEDPNTRERRFAFTPLQAAVAFQELDWVEVLLETSADPNLTGVTGGQVPHGYGRLNLNGISLELLKEMGEQTPLQINRSINATDSAAHSRNAEIERLLLRYGARDPTEADDDDTIMISSDDGE